MSLSKKKAREVPMLTTIQGVNWSDDSVDQQSKAQTLGRDDFLKIFLAQLAHQDPLNPMEGTEFTAQLAQFSSLEQLFNVNENLEVINGAQNDVSRFEALNLVGKEVMAEGNELWLEEGLNAKGAFSLEEEANCSVLIRDGSGHLIRKISLGTMGAGQQSFEWDGRSDTGELKGSGVYEFEVVALGPADQLLLAETMISGRVNRVRLDGTSPIIYIGEIPISVSELLDVHA
jgi:flagellar basal-body rod modification protein FlgD